MIGPKDYMKNLNDWKMTNKHISMWFSLFLKKDQFLLSKNYLRTEHRIAHLK
jgi:hypothetical protein